MLADHPLRYKLSNELHARPFPTVSAPGFAVFLAIKPVEGAARRDRAADFDHLLELLDRFGATHPQPGATHYFGDLGRFRLKWENHTEFTTYTVFSAGREDRPFNPLAFEVFPADWLAAAPGLRITSALIRIEEEADDAKIDQRIDEWFVAESVAAARVVDDGLVAASDFRIDSSGHIRMALFSRPGTGMRRIGRVLQRMCEIETYKTMSMLGFERSRALRPALSEVEARLTDIVENMGTEGTSGAEQALQGLLKISAELEAMLAQTGFRFDATAAYEAIVEQRIRVLREQRFLGRQSFAEFMLRRFDPAMRTVKATRVTLRNLSERAMRAAELLRTRVDVERSSQNQKLLESMNRRASLQLRLQQTVEGLSVVAISYYAVNLAGYLLYPPFSQTGATKPWLMAMLTPLVFAAVWLGARRIRRHIR